MGRGPGRVRLAMEWMMIVLWVQGYQRSQLGNEAGSGWLGTQGDLTYQTWLWSSQQMAWGLGCLVEHPLALEHTPCLLGMPMVLGELPAGH